MPAKSGWRRPEPNTLGEHLAEQLGMSLEECEERLGEAIDVLVATCRNLTGSPREAMVFLCATTAVIIANAVVPGEDPNDGLDVALSMTRKFWCGAMKAREET